VRGDILLQRARARGGGGGGGGGGWVGYRTSEGLFSDTSRYDTATAKHAVSNAFKAGLMHIDTSHDYCADWKTTECKNNSC
jgi:hypothetical protein